MLVVFPLSGCTSPQLTQGLIQVNLNVDGRTQKLSLPAGSKVQQAVTTENITLGNLDIIDPPSYTVLTDGATIKITRVRESFDISDVTIPFEHQVVKNESLPVGQQLLIQPGVNGIQEITTRIVYQDGVETSRDVFKTLVVKDPVPEILMIGVQTPFSSLPIRGKLAYLIAGNAWLMESTTGNRTPLVTSGDLDGRIFSLSPDGDWLLFSRKTPPPDDNPINTLWVINIATPESKPISLNVDNVVHFAEWVPGKPLTVSYSTVEPRPTSPGWQANNDFQELSFSAAGKVKSPVEIVPTNSGGIYGWWGTYYSWSPDGSTLAYARPDEIGLIDLENGAFIPKLAVTPLQTHSDWAWVPPLNWSPDSSVLFTVTHASGSAQISAEESQAFNVSAVLLKYGSVVSLANQSGMFAYPVSSALISGSRYQVCFLQAVFPDQSDSSRYRLEIMDQDGANEQTLFPSEGMPGIDPQQIVWAPRSSGDSGGLIALIYQGNIWFVDAITKESHQITGDGLASRIDWK